jgi:hypothetical protein
MIFDRVLSKGFGDWNLLFMPPDIEMSGSKKPSALKALSSLFSRLL